MNDNVEVKQEVENPQTDEVVVPKSFIQVVFAEIGSVIMPTPPIINCTALQALAFAEYLRIMAESGVKQEHNRIVQAEQQVKERKKILVPGLSDSDLLQ